MVQSLFSQAKRKFLKCHTPLTHSFSFLHFLTPWQLPLHAKNNLPRTQINNSSAQGGMFCFLTHRKDYTSEALLLAMISWGRQGEGDLALNTAFSLICISFSANSLLTSANFHIHKQNACMEDTEVTFSIGFTYVSLK